ncbi:MAG: tetratricopeptide repeat protein [Chloroflexi bacterium]|nr:tetratricopeptide repeat protein [Chloroflexota bacterium]
MKLFLRTGTLIKVIAIFVLIALLGLTPIPHSVSQQFQRADFALSTNNAQAAAQYYAQLAEHMHWWPELWEQAGHYAFQGADPENAVNYFHQASIGGVLSSEGQIALGDSHHQLGNSDAAIQAWLVSGPHPGALRRLADSYIAAGDYDAAIAALKTLLADSPTPALYSELGFLLAAHNPETAPPYLLSAAELDVENASDSNALRLVIQRALPQNLPAYTLLVSGQHLASRGSWDLAAHAFARAAELRPDYVEAWAYLGESLQHLTSVDPDTALDSLTQALTIDPSSLVANTMMALYWQRHGDYEGAQIYIQNALTSDQQTPILYIQFGELLALQGDLSAAQSYYQAAVEINPGDGAYHQAFAEFCIRYYIDIRTAALPAARQAVLLSPHDAAALDVLGQVLFRLADPINAERLFQRSVGEDPTYAPAFLHLGILYIEQSLALLAYDNLELAVLLAPGSQTAAHAQRLLNDLAP